MTRLSQLLRQLRGITSKFTDRVQVVFIILLWGFVLVYLLMLNDNARFLVDWHLPLQPYMRCNGDDEVWVVVERTYQIGEAEGVLWNIFCDWSKVVEIASERDDAIIYDWYEDDYGVVTEEEFGK